MAVAVEELGMGGGNEPNVHPFFASIRERNWPVKSNAAVVTAPLTVQSNPPEAMEAVTSLSKPSDASGPGQENFDASKVVTAMWKGSVKTTSVMEEVKQRRWKQEHRAEENTASKRTGEMCVSSQHRVMENFFQKQNDAGSLQQPTEIQLAEVEASERHRKRRRIHSLEHISTHTVTEVRTWDEQLKEAAKGPMNDDVPGVNDSQTVDGALPSSLQSKASSSIAAIAPSAETAEDSRSTLVEDKMIRAPQVHSIAVTPPRKLLKLRSDGKLLSPKISTGAGTKKTKGIAGSKAIVKTSPKKLVILRYGLDQGTRITIGEEIQRIISSSRPNDGNSPTKVDTIFRMSRTQEPPKLTHPFFTGKPPRPIDLDTDTAPVTAGANNQTRTEHTIISSSQKARDLTTSAAKAWATLGGLRHRAVANDLAKSTRIPGNTEPLWPPRDMQHCRGLRSGGPGDPRPLPGRPLPSHQKKLKDTIVQVSSSEDILHRFREIYHTQQSGDSNGVKGGNRSEVLRKPQRRLMTGSELQEAVRPNVRANLPPQLRFSSNTASTKPVLDNERNLPETHVALLNVFQEIATSFSAFDKFECETRDWVQKYAPNCAATVLQQSKDAMLLRDWLRSLAVVSVDTGSAPMASSLSISIKKAKGKLKKKRRRAEELDGFVISSEDEAQEMNELPDLEDNCSTDEAVFGPKKSVISMADSSDASKPSNPALRKSRTVVISGPHGSGKTAAVYAVAQELGFEIFEINAGSRRSGRDLLDRVGDVAQNHLVHQTEESEDAEDVDDQHTTALRQELSSRRQSTMQSFLSPRRKGKQHAVVEPRAKSTNTYVPADKKRSKQQKQSLILLEEVDVLFEEDKQFWTTVLDFIIFSRRPVIMTCTDESRLPLEEMVLHAILRFATPPEQLAVDYLVLIAGNEGHILCRDAVSTLYRSKNFDLRASITELNFWCQMAVGDERGGLEWMLMRSNAEECRNEQGEALRVVSVGTYSPGMGFFNRDHDLDGLRNDLSDDIEAMSETLHLGHSDAFDTNSYRNACTLMPSICQEMPLHCFQALKSYELSLDALSTADLLPGLGLRPDNKVLFDISGPELTDAARANYVDGVHLLQADPISDQMAESTTVILALIAGARSLSRSDALNCDPIREVLIPQAIHARNARTPYENTKEVFSAAFKPLVEIAKSLLPQTKGAQITGFDGPVAIVAEDIAPYVRAIVSYDIRLEEQRLYLGNLLSQGGRNGKRHRTTRASRAALEGGSKAHTRRERWFPFTTHFPLVLKSGGKEWQAMALRVQQCNTAGKDAIGEESDSHDGSRGSSMATTGSEV